jgi:uncharacterized protein
MTFDDFDPSPWIEQIRSLYQESDPAHDFTHILRVYRNARTIGQEEGADMQVLLLASLLHDAGSDKKDNSGDPEREKKNPGRQATEALLDSMCLDEKRKKEVLYAIDVHRFSRGIIPVTLEAKILQDADRLDALGAVGIARVFLTGGALGRAMYHSEDPFCRNREPDDRNWNLDHFYKKLLRLEAGMHTKSAKRLAERRTAVMKRYLADLEEEIGVIIKDISPLEGRHLIKRQSSRPEESSNSPSTRPLIILDVRTAKEYLSGHLRDSINIDFRSPSFQDQISLLDRDAAYLLYCRTGIRSRKALLIMSSMGFREIYNLSQGIEQWKREGGELVF